VSGVHTNWPTSHIPLDRNGPTHRALAEQLELSSDPNDNELHECPGGWTPSKVAYFTEACRARIAERAGVVAEYYPISLEDEGDPQ
jgi:hypothetical protein